MICTTRPRRGKPFGAPSRDRIRQLTQEIQKSWSHATRARRAAEGTRRVQLMVVSALVFDDAMAHRDDQAI